MKTPSKNREIPSNAILRLLLAATLNLISMVVNKLILALAIYQFLSHLLTGHVSERTIRWGVAMSEWTYQMSLFTTYKTERMPFPFHFIWTDRD